MEEADREEILKDELDKIEQLKREVAEIEKIQKQQLRSDHNVHHDKHHERAKRAVTHGDPKPKSAAFSKLLPLLQTKAAIGIFVGLVMLAIILIPTKTIEVTETVGKSVIEPYNITEESWVTESANVTDEVEFKFDYTVNVVPTMSGTKNEYVLWEIRIRNQENESGCWEYDYTVFVNGDEHDSGTITNMCVPDNEAKIFTTPLYALGQLEEDEKIEYSVELFPSEVPKKEIVLLMNETVLKNTTVTKYRNVTKEINETTNKTVNWLLGFSIFS